jgi:hypothetical protein
MVPFRIDKLGESIRLTSSAPDGSLGGYREAVTFGYAFNSVSFLRHVNSTGQVEWIPSRANTPGEPNTKPLVGVRDPGAIGLTFIPAVINEMMYHPKGDGDEYIELHNPYDEPAPLFGPFHDEDTWRFTAGVFYNFPRDVTIPGGGYALVVGINPAEFRQKYNVPNETPIFGPYTGELLNTGERLTLSRPADRASFVPLSMADQVVYNTTTGWPEVADGRGASLNRVSFAEYGNDILNWKAGVPTPGRPNADLLLDFLPEAGDANLDREFNQLDLVDVLRGRKYGTGEPASWAEGDWSGDGVADQRDVIAALRTGNYLQGPYAADRPVCRTDSEVFEALSPTNEADRVCHARAVDVLLEIEAPGSTV